MRVVGLTHYRNEGAVPSERRFTAPIASRAPEDTWAGCAETLDRLRRFFHVQPGRLLQLVPALDR